MKITILLMFAAIIAGTLVSCGGDRRIEDLERSYEQIEWRMERIESVMDKVQKSKFKEQAKEFDWTLSEIEKNASRLGKELDDVFNSKNEAGEFSNSEIDDTMITLDQLEEDTNELTADVAQMKSKLTREGSPEDYKSIEKLENELKSMATEIGRMRNNLENMKRND